MESLDKSTHVFIVRVWRERREIENVAPEWRGVIEHVPSGRRQYVNDLDEIGIFIMPYLEEFGIEPTLCWQVRQWLKHWLDTRNKRA